jgi:hypothetical protein
MFNKKRISRYGGSCFGARVNCCHESLYDLVGAFASPTWAIEQQAQKKLAGLELLSPVAQLEGAKTHRSATDIAKKTWDFACRLMAELGHGDLHTVVGVLLKTKVLYKFAQAEDLEAYKGVQSPRLRLLKAFETQVARGELPGLLQQLSPDIWLMEEVRNDCHMGDTTLARFRAATNLSYAMAPAYKHRDLRVAMDQTIVPHLQIVSTAVHVVGQPKPVPSAYCDLVAAVRFALALGMIQRYAPSKTGSGWCPERAVRWERRFHVCLGTCQWALHQSRAAAAAVLKGVTRHRVRLIDVDVEHTRRKLKRKDNDHPAIQAQLDELLASRVRVV